MVCDLRRLVKNYFHRFYKFPLLLLEPDEICTVHILGFLGTILHILGLFMAKLYYEYATKKPLVHIWSKPVIL